MTLPSYKYSTLECTFPRELVLNIALNRPPNKLNALNQAFWPEFLDAFTHVATDPRVRAVLVSSTNPRAFTAGLDLKDAPGNFGAPPEGPMDAGRKMLTSKKFLKTWQATFNAIEHCGKPVLVAVNGVCIGGGVHLVSACDVRFASKDAVFSIRETALGMIPDLGSLQRLAKAVGNDSILRELALTGRNFSAAEAKEMGMVGRVFETKEEMYAHALTVATQIASNSPSSTAAVKDILNYSRDHGVSDGLNYVSVYATSHGSDADRVEAFSAFAQRRKAVFGNL
ncbi:ClpP/crotonase [Gonapodya prolifera JEL478]|uniref:ClpP/crotonase n=1 Tax=Gonapodya prolifera (strain JEL478) TaxID=1344416 RepID=A0A139AE74_GONPJ|nr:ClpP/crotonase [Gonapodya prolifera JEL478]|eukprot:KXS15060.1 ClpP/crotonase [Gonapodya prolifera JEL478]